MNFWDDPRNQPSSGSWPAEGTITRLAVVESPRFARLTLCVELDGDGRQRWCSARLWRALAESRADVGERVRVTRGPDDARPDGTPVATWLVEKVAAPQPQPQPKEGWWAGPRTGPIW